MKNIAKVKARALDEIRTDEDLVVLMVVAIFLAAFGLINEDVYLIIGAMIVAPLFDPILSTVVFFFSRDWKEFFASVKTVTFLFVLAFLVSLIIFTFFNAIGDYSHSIESLYANTGIDDFIIASLLGLVGMLLWLWPKTPNITSGIAVAITLEPPLAAFGAAIITSDMVVAQRAIFTVLVNLFGVLFGAFIALAWKYRTDKNR